MIPIRLVWLILLLPVASFAIIALLIRPFVKEGVEGRRLYHHRRHRRLAGAVPLGTLFTVLGEPAHEMHIPDISWLAVGNLHFSVGLLMDSLTAVMLVVVTIVSLMVQIYSQGYMAQRRQPGYHRYYAYMSLFTASMLGLVLADNLLLMFVFWEMVGLCSYLLIGFWFHRPSAANAAKKAFIVTRLGDFGFLAAILLILLATPALSISTELHELAVAGDAGRQRPDLGGHRHLRRGRRQVGPVPAARLAAGRHGRPHPGQRPHPCRHHGRAGVFLVARTFPLFVNSAAGPHGRRRHRRLYRHLRRHHGPGHERYQARAGLLHHQPARLHDAGSGRGGPGADA